MMAKFSTVASVLAMGIALAGAPALAQSIEEDAAAETAASQDDSGNREIVVTAQRRAESVQDVPLTIAAFDSAMVEASGSVRRQNIWRRSRRKLVESGPRLGIDIRRRAFGAASADIGWSVV